jgi:predicted negative regulator of RcsB-dependent stress response
MSVYMTEEEQLETIKKWWARHGNLISVCLSLVILAIAGFRYTNWHHDKVTQQASVTYERMMYEYSNQQTKAVRSYANQLINEYGNTVYADAAHMTLAKIDISKDNLKAAKAELETVASKSKMPALKQIAKIRIARILAADKSYNDALKELSVVEDNAYLPVINELKGDIHSAKGQYLEAITAYRLAIDGVKSNGMVNLFLEMKTNELASKSETKGIVDNKIQSV